MDALKTLVIGGGIGGLTSAIALRREGFSVDLVEKDPDWSVYGVGIIQQSNVVRAVKQLGIIDDYIDAGFGFDHVEVFSPLGVRVAMLESPRLVEGYPANVGISRRALHKVLGKRAQGAGASIRLGVTVEAFDDDGRGVTVQFSDGTEARYDLVVGADGMWSQTRQMLLPDAAEPAFTGQSVWRYNFPRSPDTVNLCAYEGRIGIGLVPLSDALMYMYVTTPEPGNPRYPREGIARAMAAKLADAPPALRALAEQILDDEEVVYKPLYSLFLDGKWHRGRTVLIGDAAHSTTPHLGQGAGMAIEDSIVLAEELKHHASIEEAFGAFRNRRFARCKYIVEQSRAVCFGQIGIGPVVEQAHATHAMHQRVAEPI
jgi:2-polyprenyl-6-methoxyphenol hydroxylase-like FAD-dependent oxidoreductase